MFTTSPTTARPLQHSQNPEVRSRWLTQLTELISFPTISAQPQHRNDLQACAQWLARHLAEIGLHHIQILHGPNNGHPSIYADWLQAPNKPTLLLYGHYDVQPIDPVKAWKHPPFQAIIIVIPSQGIARFSFRLVPDQNPQEIAYRLRQHIAATTHPAIQTELSISGIAAPVLLPRNSHVMQAAQRAITQSWGVPPAFTRSGGTIPFIGQLHRRLRIPIVLMGFGLPDDNIHAPNEKMSLTNFFRGIDTVIRFFAEYGR